MKTRFKLVSLIISLIFVFTNCCLVFADEANEIPVNIKLQVRNSNINIGEVFKVNFALDFQSEVDKTGGIPVFRCGIKFDSQVLEILDPDTNDVLETDEGGNPTNGNFFVFGELGIENSMSVKMNSEKNMLIVLYASKDAAGDIFESGPILQLAFKAKKDLEINQSIYTNLELINPEVSFSNTECKSNPESESLAIQLLPQFSIPAFGSQKQNTTLNIRGRSTIGTDAELPLNAQIKQGENVIEEKQANLTLTGFNVSFDLAEDVYSPGDYTLVMTYGNQTASRSFEVLKKDEVITPAPDDNTDDTKDDGDNSASDSDKKDDSTNNSKDDSNSGNSNNNSNNSNNSDSGSTSNSGNVTGIGGSTNSGTSKPNGSTSDSNGSNNQNQNKPANKSNYPTDIAEHWAKTYVEYVYDNSLMNGYADGTFLPEGNINRGEFATVMSRLMGYTENSAPADKFNDLNSHWAKGYIGALVEKGIVNGTSDTEFSPDANISRQEIAVLISRAYNLKGNDEKFADDSKIADWAKDGVYAVKAAGYMQGDTDNNFNPENGATRGEVATVITRLHKSK